MGQTDWSYGTETVQGIYKFYEQTYTWASVLFEFVGKGKEQEKRTMMVSFGMTKAEASDRVKARYKGKAE